MFMDVSTLWSINSLNFLWLSMCHPWVDYNGFIRGGVEWATLAKE